MAPTVSLPVKEAPEDPTRFLVTITEENESAVCVFCKSSKLDEVNWGVMYEKDGIITHYFCMLLSAALKQNGKDDEGILGFLPVDITKEVRRCQRLKCVYCGELGASVGCCNKRCKIIFHLPCGIQNGTNSQFHSNFESYCPKHAKHKRVSLCNTAKESCPICMCEVDADERIVKATCCKASIFHKECIQRMATSAGYLFKCPTCNKTKSFIHEMKSSGIFVPDQDASWEKDNSFGDLYVRYSHCDAPECNCSEGREYSDENGNWSLARCRLCGAQGVHKHCGNLGSTEDWACDPCLEVEKKADLIPKTAQPKPPLVQTSNDLQTPGTSQRSVTLNKRSTPAQPRKRKIPKTPATIPQSHVDSSEEVKLGNCTIHSSCFSYFPYTKNRLKNFKSKRNTLPDWREMELQVNLVRWMPDLQFVTLRVPAQATSTSGMSPSPSKSRGRWTKPRKPAAGRKKEKSIMEMEAEEVMSDTLKQEEEEVFLPPVEMHLSPSRGRRKRSLWSAGIHNTNSLKRRLMRRNKQPPSHTVTSAEEGEEAATGFPVAVNSPPINDDLIWEPEFPAVEHVEESGIEVVDLSLSSEEDEYPTEGREVEKPSLLPSSASTSPEPTPEQMNSFKVLGDRLRTELSQNRENELSPPRGRPGITTSYFSSEGYKNIRRRKQWFSPERIKERQVAMGDPEL